MSRLYMIVWFLLVYRMRFQDPLRLAYQQKSISDKSHYKGSREQSYTLFLHVGFVGFS